MGVEREGKRKEVSSEGKRGAPHKREGGPFFFGGGGPAKNHGKKRGKREGKK